MPREHGVRMERRGPLIDLDFENQALGAVHINNDSLPKGGDSGAARSLLGASVLYCFLAALDHALVTRGAAYEAIEGGAKVRAGENGQGQSRILGMTLDVIVRMDANYKDIFEQVAAIMRKGCLVSATLEAAFPIEYNLSLECPDDQK